MAYIPTTYTPGGNVEQYILDEFSRLSEELRTISEGFAFVLQKAEPAKPRLGMVVLADGINWNPLATGVPHLVVFNGTTWIAP